MMVGMTLFNDLPQLIEAAGYIGLCAIVFAESGLFFGFFFPGDSLIFTSGLLASQGYLSIWLLVPLLALSAIAGDSVGYWFGARVGPALFCREDSFFFHKKHLERTRDYFAKYGARTIIIARLIPIVRTFAPIFAGVGHMPYRTFITYNIAGGIAWTTSFVLFGYFLGSVIPNAERYTLPLIAVIIILSFLPIIKELRRTRN